jgi:hypothetical protein
LRFFFRFQIVKKNSKEEEEEEKEKAIKIPVEKRKKA